MGAALVGVALNTHWSTLLNERERLVLVLMAHTAHDTDRGPEKPARLYWGGHDPIILSLFGELDPGTPAYRTAATKVKRAIARLVDVGALERLEIGRRGHRTVYKVTLNMTQAALFDLHPPAPRKAAG